MSALELRLPPLLVVVLVAALMALPPWIWPLGRWGGAIWPWIAALLLLVGAATCAAGVLAFRRQRTTVNPLHPEAASSLVAVGPYRYSRNPMYLGFLLVLAGWALWLAHPLSLIGLPLYVIYLNRFQIVPEERLLLQRFGEPYRHYLGRVRRWL